MDLVYEQCMYVGHHPHTLLIGTRKVFFLRSAHFTQFICLSRYTAASLKTLTPQYSPV